jgi:hypothetical protein
MCQTGIEVNKSTDVELLFTGSDRLLLLSLQLRRV